MLRRWIRYGAAWTVCLIFFLAHRQWMAWVVLLGISCLPLFSLAVSLPAMLLARITLSVPRGMTQGTLARLQVGLKCPLPAPLWKVRIQVNNTLTGETWRLKPGQDIPADHCGAVYIQVSRGRVYDYMGLFCLPRKAPGAMRVLIRPRQLRPRELPDPQKNIITYWRPKAGGGFSENHDLRLYRPGDSLRQIHWKLSGKTGKLIYREPMELVSNRLVLRLVHGGNAGELDRKLGRLLWMGLYLRRRGLVFDVLADTPEGPVLWHVSSKKELQDVLDALLCTRPLSQERLSGTVSAGMGQYYLGGEADEAQ